MSESVLLENAAGCLVLAKQYAVGIAVLWILVFLVSFCASVSVTRLKELGPGKDRENVKRTVRMNRISLVCSLVALVAMAAIYPLYENLLPLPAEELFPLLANGGMKACETHFVDIFGPLFIFFVVLATAAWWSLCICFKSRHVTTRSVTRKYLDASQQ